jgi:hypothetical protein
MTSKSVKIHANPDVCVSPSLTHLGEIGSVYPEFVIIIAIGLQKPYAILESGANLVLV